MKPNSKKPHIWKLGFLILTANAYQVEYIDCDQPELLKIYNAKRICQTTKETKDHQEPLTLLQQASTSTTVGWSCQLIVTRFPFKCGTWSHLKVQSIPTIEEHQEVSISRCQEIVNQQKFRPTNSMQAYPIKLNRQNIIKITEVGTLREVNDGVVCKGESVHIGNTMHTNVVQLAIYKVTARKEKYIIKQEEVEVKSEHLHLSCAYSKRGCISGEGTFIWEIPAHKCNLERIQTFNPIRIMDTYLYDFQGKLLINTTGTSKINNCGDILLTTTEYPDIYIANGNQVNNLPYIKPADLEITVDYRLRDSFILYEAEKLVRHSRRNLEENICQENVRMHSREPFPLGNDIYGILTGAAVQTFKCTKGTAKIKESKVCYTDIPIVSSKTSYVDPLTSILKHHSTIIPCSSRWPMQIETTTGWVALRPGITPVSTPPAGSLNLEAEITHEDTHKGLYTSESLKAWEGLISFPAYHEALLNELTWGNCINSGACNHDSSTTNGITNYDIDRLMPTIEVLNPWTQLRQFIKQNGDYLALLVIVWTISQILLNLIILTITMVNEGPAAMLAMMTLIFCNRKNQYNKIRRRNRRCNRTIDEEEATVENIPLANPSPTGVVANIPLANPSPTGMVAYIPASAGTSRYTTTYSRN